MRILSFRAIIRGISYEHEIRGYTDEPVRTSNHIVKVTVILLKEKGKTPPDSHFFAGSFFLLEKCKKKKKKSSQWRCHNNKASALIYHVWLWKGLLRIISTASCLGKKGVQSPFCRWGWVTYLPVKKTEVSRLLTSRSTFTLAHLKEHPPHP